MEPSECLICCQNIIGSGKDSRGSSAEKIENGELNQNQTTRKQVEVIFLLQKLLGVPRTKLEEYLEDSEGRNPDSWVELCGECGEMVKSARQCFDELLEVKRRFEGIRGEVVERMKLFCGDKKKAVGRSRKKGRRVVEETRTFVCGCVGVGRKSERIRTETERDVVEKLLGELETPEQQEIPVDVEYGSMIVLKEEQEDYDDPSRYPETGIEDSPNDPDWDPFSDGKLAEGEKTLPAKRKVRTEMSEGVATKILQSCNLCDKVYESRFGLWKHRKTVHKISGTVKGRKNVTGQVKFLRLPCDKCDKVYESRFGLWKHIKKVHEGIQVPRRKEEKEANNDATVAPREKLQLCCEACGKTYESRFGLWKHRKKVHGHGNTKTGNEVTVEPVEVETEPPPKPRKNKAGVNFVHDEDGKRIFVCDANGCGLTFQSRFGLWKHKKKYCGKPTRVRKFSKLSYEKVPCPHCSFTGNKYHLTVHINRMHENNFPYFCEQCGKGEKTKTELRYHQAQFHFVCGYKDCQISSESREQLREHQVTVHGREVDVFKCEECGKHFTALAKLKKHLKIHEYERKKMKGEGGGFICDLCGKAFPIREYLHHHVWSTHQRQRKKTSSARGTRSAEFQSPTSSAELALQ